MTTRLPFDCAQGREPLERSSPKSAEGRWLGVDYGSSRLGLSRSDPDGLMAIPLEVHPSEGMEKDVEYVAKLARTLGAVGIVVGLPIRLDGSESPATVAATEFARQLKGACAIPVVAWDERLSTVEADKALKEAGLSRRRRAERADKVAAALILQAYLDRQRESPPDRQATPGGRGVQACPDPGASCQPPNPTSALPGEVPAQQARPLSPGAPQTTAKRLSPRTIGLVTAVGILGILVFWSLWLISPPRGREGEVRFRVPVNASARAVASALKEQHLIRNATLFCLLSRLKGVDDKFKAGVHLLDSSLSTPQVISSLVAGDRRPSDIAVTIPEGHSLLQIASVLQDGGVVPAGDFLASAQGRAVAAGLVSFPLPQGSLEGYLFPDTYYFQPDSDAQVVVGKMLSTFERKVYLPLKEELADSALSFQEMIVLASLVEREAKLPRERPLIAGVYLNRLRKGMRLECDATIQYALGRHKPRLLYSDLKVDSPYNTYLHPGLPPGPICNPGVDSVRAALKPVESDYLYYVARPDGSHVFSRTFAEHRAVGG